MQFITNYRNIVAMGRNLPKDAEYIMILSGFENKMRCKLQNLRSICHKNVTEELKERIAESCDVRFFHGYQIGQAIRHTINTDIRTKARLQLKVHLVQ